MPAGAHIRLIEVLREAREFLARHENEFVWSSWDSREDALRQMDGIITQLDAGELPARTELTVLFAPTGNIQEVAESSGWGGEFLALAERFDAAIDSI